MTTAPLLDIADLVVRFGPVRAVDGVSLNCPRARTASHWSARAVRGRRPSAGRRCGW